MEDWEEHEPADPRGRKRASAKARRAPDPAAAHRAVVLQALYHIPFRPGRRKSLGILGVPGKPDYLIPSRVAMRLGIEAWGAAVALLTLAKDGFVRGPMDLPKLAEDGSPIRYQTDQGQVEWDGKKWVTSINEYEVSSWKRDARGKFVRVPKKEIQRRIRQLERSRRTVIFDGRGFELLEDGAVYVEYGRRMGYFDEPIPKKETSPPKEVCPRCFSVVEYRNRHGKRRRDHGLRKCNVMLVKRIMEE